MTAGSFIEHIGTSIHAVIRRKWNFRYLIPYSFAFPHKFAGTICNNIFYLGYLSLLPPTHLHIVLYTTSILLGMPPTYIMKFHIHPEDGLWGFSMVYSL